MSFRILSILVGLALATPGAARAQAAAAADTTDSADAVFARARQLVAGGNGTAGRLLVDSVLAAATPHTRDYAEALYWRAALAPTSAEAEPDYRRLIVEYPLSPRAADALLQLAEIEIARGDRPAAQAHLERFLLENPDRADRGRAGFLLTRALMDANNAPRACAVLARTINAVPPDSVELRNQFDFIARSCEGVDTTRVVAPAAVPAAVPAVVRAPPRRAPARPRREIAAKRDTTPAKDTASAVSPSDVIIPPHSLPARAEPVVPTSPEPVVAANPPEQSDTALMARPRPERHSVPESRRSKPHEAGRYSLQVAAYATRAAADALVARLAKRDIDARVVGTSKPFRVRIGAYATRAEAEKAAKGFASRGIRGFIATSRDGP